MAKRKKKKALVAPPTILAVAIGPQASHTFTSMTDPALDTVRPYIKGLVYRLFTRGKRIGTDYTVDYRQVSNPATLFGGMPNPNIVFCMSRTVAEAASAKYPEGAQIPIVAIVSSPSDFNNNRNVFGISGQRAQKGRDYYNKFQDAVPTLKMAGQKVYVLTKKDYPPTQMAFASLPSSPDIVEVKVSNLAEIEAAIPTMTPGGLLVLPADLFFGNAARIIELAQAQKLPDFWPVTDWVKSTLPSALGGYGVPQLMCGQILGDRVFEFWTQGWPNQRFTNVSSTDFVWMASVSAAIARDVALDMPPGMIVV
jgi:hypothetical protein